MVLRKIVTLLVVVLLALDAPAQLMPVAKNGLLDASAYDFQHAKSLKLNGEWEYYQNKLVEPFEVLTKQTYTAFPHLWDADHAQGFATYKLRVVVPSDISSFALNVPQVYCTYALWVNGSLVAENGVIGTTRKETVAQWLPQVVTIADVSDTLSITLQLANFHHSIGGIKNPIYLSLPDKLKNQQNSAHVVNMVLLGVLTFIGVFFLSIYAFVRREKSVLFFALLCFSWALRSIFSEQYLAIHWMPWFDWELGVKIEYITLYLTMAWAVLAIANFYPLDTNKLVKRILLYPNFLFVFLTMATPALVYTRMLTIYLGLAALLLIYVIVVILRAVLYERYGAWFSVFSIVTLVATFAYNYLVYAGVFEFSPIALYSSYLIFFFFLAIALAYQLSPKAGDRNYSETLSFDDLMSKK